MRLEELYERLKKEKRQEVDVKSWLAGKEGEVRSLLVKLRSLGQKVDVDVLVNALNALAEAEGKRRRKEVQTPKGKRVVYEGVQVKRKDVEELLKRIGVGL